MSDPRPGLVCALFAYFWTILSCRRIETARNLCYVIEKTIHSTSARSLALHNGALFSFYSHLTINLPCASLRSRSIGLSSLTPPHVAKIRLLCSSASTLSDKRESESVCFLRLDPDPSVLLLPVSFDENILCICFGVRKGVGAEDSVFRFCTGV